MKNDTRKPRSSVKLPALPHGASSQRRVKRSPWFMGIDLGTGSCKTIVVDEKASVLGFGVAEYEGGGVQDRWQEQDPRELLGAMTASVRMAIRTAGVASTDCAGLSIGGALHSIMAVDGRGHPLTGVMTWADGRAVQQSGSIRNSSKAVRLYRQTGCPVHGMYPLYKIIWIRETLPEVFRKARRYLSAKEYVFHQLTGQYLVDYSLAAGSGLLNTRTLQWSDLALDLAGIGEEQLSSLSPPTAIQGRLRTDLARQMGLPVHTPVVLGSSDAVNSSLGAGAVSAQQATCMVGTSGALRVISRGPILDSKARSWCYAIDESHWLVGGAINNGGVALSWLTDVLNQAAAPLLQERRMSFEDVLALAGKAKAGAGGVLCLPFFAGERSPHWNLNARALFFGLTLEHEIKHLARSLLEGIAFRFRNLRDVLTDVGVDLRDIIASGGFTKSDLWVQTIADALNHELVVPAWGETSSLGAAFWAMLGAGRVDSLEAFRDYVRLGKTYRPDRKRAAVYDRVYPIYTRLYRALEGSFDEVAELQRDLAHG